MVKCTECLIVDCERHSNFREIVRIANGNLHGKGLTANRQQWGLPKPKTDYPIGELHVCEHAICQFYNWCTLSQSAI